MKIKIILLLLTLLISPKSIFATDYKDLKLKDLTLEGDNTFSGTIYIEGRVTVNENASLAILAGTKVIFIFNDSDEDGIGESEILSQGKIMVLGSKEQPVIFSSDKKERGSWLGFSIMSVDSQSVFNYAIFEDAYMALHSHFSNLKILNTTFRNNLRGFQSQEGTIIMNNCYFHNNNTALQFRNSKANISEIRVHNNLGGINFLYSDVTLKNIDLKENSLFGIKIRFSKSELIDVNITKSMQNLYGRSSEIYAKNLTSSSALLRGISFEGSTVELLDSKISENLLDGISLDSSYLKINNVTLNKNARFDIYLKGKAMVEGAENYKELKIYEEK